MTIYFDMDGTIANLYAVNGWLEMLQSYDATPYAVAEPMWDMEEFSSLLNAVQSCGYKIGIVSWLSKCSTKEYNKAVRNAKRNWLKDNLPAVTFDEIHIVKYGTPKHYIVNDDGILFDDELNNRVHWNGEAYEPYQIMEVLASLIF